MTDNQPFTLTVEIGGQLLEDVEDAREYLRQRLLGQVPVVIEDLFRSIDDSFFESWRKSGTVIRINRPSAAECAPDPRSEEEIAAYEAAIDADMAELEAWQASPEGRASEERDFRFDEFRQGLVEQTSAEFEAWIENEAAEFNSRRNAWWKHKRAEQEAQFAELDGTVETHPFLTKASAS